MRVLERLARETGREYAPVSYTHLVEEKFQSWVLGVNDFEADYDDFIAELKARGIDRALEINQKAYDTYLGKN